MRMEVLLFIAIVISTYILASMVNKIITIIML